MNAIVVDILQVLLHPHTLVPAKCCVCPALHQTQRPVYAYRLQAAQNRRTANNTRSVKSSGECWRRCTLKSSAPMSSLDVRLGWGPSMYDGGHPDGFNI